MNQPRSIVESLATLRTSGRARPRRLPAASNAAGLMAHVLGACRVVSIDEGPGGIAFRFECREGEVVRITCLLHHATPAPLTAAEAAVAERLCEGHTLAQVARLRGVSVNTIKSQVRQIFRKLDVDSRVALVRKLAP